MGSTGHSGLNTGHSGPGQHFGLQNNYQGSFSQDRQLQHNSNWGSSLSNGLGNDWTMLDPAIVTGQLANPLEPPVSHLGRSDSPPNWITANLEQLTEGTGGPYQQQQQNNLIPAFNGLGLGGDRLGLGGDRLGLGADRLGLGGSNQARARLGAAPGGWGGPSSTATPPPGFSHHRQQNIGQHYQGFGGVNKNTEAQKIGEF